MTQARSDFGFATERHFINGTFDMRDLGKFPPWLGFFCAADEKADAEGIDVWAYTDVGKIPLQIKAGRKARNKHQRRENRKHIPCVAFPPRSAFKDVFDEALKLLEEERNRILAERAART